MFTVGEVVDPVPPEVEAEEECGPRFEGVVGGDALG
jgi:hypothetical protein